MIDLRPIALLAATCALTLMPVAATAAAAQDAGGSAPPPAGDDDAPPRPKSLDELLGLEDATAGSDGSTDVELDDPAAEVDLGDLFREAVGLMGSVSDRLGGERDVGLAVQRDQQEVIRLLEALIDAADEQQMQQMQQQQQQSSSDSGEEQRRRQPGQQSQGGQGEQSQQERLQPGGGESTGNQPPPPEGVVLREVLDESQTEWGALPERVRDLLLQGTGERFSSLYDRMTRAYYRRLAEEGSR